MQKNVRCSGIAGCVPGLTKKGIGTWCYRGFLNGTGCQSATGCWLYAGLDAIALRLTQQLLATGQKLGQAVVKGGAYSKILAVHIRGQGAELLDQLPGKKTKKPDLADLQGRARA